MRPGGNLPVPAAARVWFPVRQPGVPEVPDPGITVAFSLIVYFSCFFTVSSDGLRAVLSPVSDFLSGGLIPLPFMPKTLAAVIRYSPFGAMLNAPLRIFSGDISGAAMWETLFLQVFWTAVLVLAGVLLQKKGMSRLTVQGG